jgi:hypothetical protein
MRQREDGACLAYSKSDGQCFVLPRSEYPRLKQEWMAGRAFWEGIGFYGAPCVIKLADIVAISDSTSEAMAARAADDKADKAEDAIES